MKKSSIKILWFAAALGAFVVFVWMARPTGTSGDQSNETVRKTGAITLKVSEKSYNFGTISMAAGKVKREFKIKNEGQDAVTISKLYTSCMCTSAKLASRAGNFGPFGMPGHGIVPTISAAVEPGEEATVEVTFDPAAHGPAGVGRISRVVKIETETGGALELKIDANVTP